MRNEQGAHNITYSVVHQVVGIFGWNQTKRYVCRILKTAAQWLVVDCRISSVFCEMALRVRDPSLLQTGPVAASSVLRVVQHWQLGSHKMALSVRAGKWREFSWNSNCHRLPLSSSSCLHWTNSVNKRFRLIRGQSTRFTSCSSALPSKVRKKQLRFSSVAQQRGVWRTFISTRLGTFHVLSQQNFPIFFYSLLCTLFQDPLPPWDRTL